MQPPGDCEQRWILAERHKADRRAYQTAVLVLRRAISTPGFEEAKEHAAQCQTGFERSRDALEMHMLEHGCGDLAQADARSTASGSQ
jgi:hypothetical protein